MEEKLVAKMRCAACGQMVENETEAITHVKAKTCNEPFFTVRYVVVEVTPPMEDEVNG